MITHHTKEILINVYTKIVKGKQRVGFLCLDGEDNIKRDV